MAFAGLSIAEIDLLEQMGETFSVLDRRRAERVAFPPLVRPPVPEWDRISAAECSQRQRRMADDLMRDVERRNRIAG